MQEFIAWLREQPKGQNNNLDRAIILANQIQDWPSDAERLGQYKQHLRAYFQRTGTTNATWFGSLTHAWRYYIGAKKRLEGQDEQ